MRNCLIWLGLDGKDEILRNKTVNSVKIWRCLVISKWRTIQNFLEKWYTKLQYFTDGRLERREVDRQSN